MKENSGLSSFVKLLIYFWGRGSPKGLYFMKIGLHFCVLRSPNTVATVHCERLKNGLSIYAANCSGLLRQDNF